MLSSKLTNVVCIDIAFGIHRILQILIDLILKARLQVKLFKHRPELPLNVAPRRFVDPQPHWRASNHKLFAFPLLRRPLI